MKGREGLHQVIQGLELRKKRLQLIEWQGARTIALCLIWIWMGFEKNPGQTDGQTCPGKFCNLLATSS